MPIKSPYPATPAIPEVNAHYALLRRPDQAQWSNFPIHINAETGQSRGFKDFVQRVEWAATALGSPVDKGGLGLSGDNGDMIGIMSANCMDYITFAHACLYITTPFALISSYSKPFELKNTLTLSRATCLFIDEKFLSMALPIAKEAGLPSTRIFIMTGNAPGYKNFSQLIDEARTKNFAVLNVQPAKKNTLAYLVFSSGTTGLPKAVMISHGNLLGVIAQYSLLGQIAQKGKSTEPNEPFKVLAFLPLHHTYGFFTFIIGMFLFPTTSIIMSQWNIDLALDLIPKYRINRLPLIPSIVYQLVHHPKLAKTDLTSITYVNSGAAYLSPKLAEKLSSFIPQKADFIEGYGMSEGTVATLRSPAPGSLDGRLNPRRGSTGVLLPNLVAKILREDGTEADVNEVGELWIKGPTVSLGYWNNEKATKETFVDGWLKTGDKFRVNEDGYFFFADRAKDTLKVSGAQVSPVEIEDLLLAHPKKLIEDVTVAGVSGGRTSDEKVPRAWIVLSCEGKNLGEATVIKELERWHQKNLSKYKWLRGGIEIVNEIPKSPTGKVLRRELQDRFEQRLVHTKKAMSKL
ncbi:hypothetical protein M378DRAFT_74729 [Amanita muscaria Koide BX008]|uniref:Uncharacterized protein n=1 Tax=Amanita muscaria (strain Koide BX008) TaxID=946122 RepID=A0A0C2TIM9_AMAMK|nr:hypothetical protein M378DRAFT_74729 [Amanita muscaria Koide BX008]